MPDPQPARIALALQGGGAHGAFTWGVLDRLLEDVAAGRLAITAISGASAGALNAATCAAGLAKSPGVARERLRGLWEAIERNTHIWSPALSWLPPQPGASPYNIDWTASAFFRDVWRQFVSPYDLWWYSNGLKQIAGDAIDFGWLNDLKRAPPVYLGATEIRQTRRDVFTQPGLDVDHILASACIPEAFRAIEIGDAVYWDGGFLGNPPLEPLFAHATDLVVVWINPLHRPDGPPRTARDILDRLNEITFNVSLVAELRGIRLINKLLADGKLAGDHGYRPIRVHIVTDEPWLSALGLASKTTPPPGLIAKLYDVGRTAADDWAKVNLPVLGSAHESAEIIEALLDQVRYRPEGER
jgi:NTE family protein